MDTAERTLLEQTVRDAIAGAGTMPAGTVDDVLTELGWLEMLREEPDVAVDIVFRELGRASGIASVLDDVFVSALGVEPRADLAVVLPRYGTWQPPGTIEREQVSVIGFATARVPTAREVLVVCDDATEVVTLSTSVVGATPVSGIDPDAAFHTVRLELAAAAPTPLDPDAWDAAVALGRRAIATQIAGACRAMLDLARTHALEREQFGRPVARFQAVRHRLADALIAVEALEATLVAAADEPTAMTAALAKAVAGRTARAVGTHCQQVLAGIGFTTDHPFHRYLKRTMALEGVLGSADDITLDVGRQLVAARSVPTLIEL